MIGNVLGCFVMAVFFSNMNRISRVSTPFYKMLSTGFCGCLTTFASWMNTASNTKAERYSILIVTVEFAITWCAFCLGFTLGEGVHHAFFEYYSTRVHDIGSYFVTYIERYRLHNHSVEQPVDEGEALMNGNDNSTHTADADISFNPIGVVEAGNDPTGNSRSSSVASRLTEDDKRQMEEKQEKWDKIELMIYFVLFFLFYIPIVVMVGYLNDLEDSSQRINLVRSLLLAPFGAWIRWYLSRIDQLRQFWPTLNLHTLIANIIGTVYEAILLTFYDSWAWTKPIDDGNLLSVNILLIS